MHTGNARPTLDLVKLDASVPTPIGITSQDVIPLSRALCRVYFASIDNGDPLAAPAEMDVHTRRAFALLYRAGVLATSGISADGFAGVMLDTMPVLTGSAALPPGPGARWLDLAMLYRPAVPATVLAKKTTYHRLLAHLLRKDDAHTAPSAYASWLALARRQRRVRPIVMYHRSRAVYNLWPGGPEPLERAVLLVDGVVGQPAPGAP